MFATLLVNFYRLVHGRLHLPGAGWLIRRLIPLVPALKNYQLSIPSVGSVNLDFRDIASFGILNYSLGDYGDDKVFLAVIDRFIQENQVFWDIGANVGYFSMYLALPPHKLKTIYCFEPNPDAFRRLSDLFRDHPVVKTFPYALGAEDAEMEMSVPEKGSQLGSLTRTVDPHNTIKVAVRSGDQLRESARLELPHLMKIDVEGFEPQVLAGLKKTIQTSRPLIFFEHIWLTEADINSMLPSGYAALLILENGNISSDWAFKSQSFNGILVPLEKKEWVERSRLPVPPTGK